MKCKACEYKTESWSSLRRHFYAEHGDPVPKIQRVLDGENLSRLEMERQITDMDAYADRNGS